MMNKLMSASALALLVSFAPLSAAVHKADATEKHQEKEVTIEKKTVTTDEEKSKKTEDVKADQDDDQDDDDDAEDASN